MTHYRHMFPGQREAARDRAARAINNKIMRNNRDVFRTVLVKRLPKYGASDADVMRAISKLRGYPYNDGKFVDSLLKKLLDK